MKTKHTHKPVDGSQWGTGAGQVPKPCTHRGDGNCPTTSAHITVGCRCGAYGVICPMRTYIAWHPRAEGC